MTTEEKLQHFYDFSMESARNEAQAMLDAHSLALENQFRDHQETINRQAQMQLDDAANMAKRDFNKSLSSEQLVIKRTLSKKHTEINDKIFAEVQQKLLAFKDTPNYKDYLCRKFKEAWDFASGDEMVIYIDPSDAASLDELTAKTGIVPTISKEVFLGGMRAVISSKNILIDNSFTSLLKEEKASYVFDGGRTHE